MGTRSNTALNVSLGLELFEGVDDSTPCEPILPGQIACGRNACSRTQPAFQNLRSKGFIKPVAGRQAWISCRKNQLKGGRSFHAQNGTSQMS